MRFCVLAFLIACSGNKPTGGSGTGDIVFTTPFVGTMGFASSVAIGRPIIIAVHREGSPDGDAAAEMELQVSNGPYRIVQLAAGQALVWLDAEGDYRITAVRYGSFAGQEPLVRARKVLTVRAFESARRITRNDAGCEQIEDAVPIGDLSLASNQELQVSIVGIDQTENPTSGWLTLTPQTVPAEINVETPFLGGTGVPNTFVIRPAGDLGATIGLVITEAETKTNVALTIVTSADAAPCEVMK